MPSSATPTRRIVARRELDPGPTLILRRQKIHRHAEQQREQHDGRAVVLGKESRGGRDDDARDHPGQQLSAATVSGDQAAMMLGAHDWAARRQ